ncbi:hypothetical protein FNV43_RR01734 [Rhamnella rubrinervis]|uniref:BHLH domain-containing protein n=1 Tax=Rhamnella rubrinervis TaxID=2594499 RepID=A0A8K0HQD2_9ROSA|nr:hypothetical protein FNV43_RR01734 [Rhamnella rubrinervis]
MFARSFLRSLLKLKRNRPNYTSSSSSEMIRKRSQRIKLAAYSSMARVVGPRRAWSRAILFKLQTRARYHYFNRRRRSSCLDMEKRTTTMKKKTKRVMIKNISKVPREMAKSQTSKLRELVPGGKDMDKCSLFEETAHYIQCLSTQVKVMQAIADRFSSK